ncbi:MAG: hypothetical protein ACX931_04860 [Saccharospirillum sp.]
MEILILPFVALVVLVMFADLARLQWQKLKRHRQHKREQSGRDNARR